jgi:Ca-activated chloride channel family protein
MFRDAIRVLCVLLIGAAMPACKSAQQPANQSQSQPQSADKIELTFTYSSEKEAWIKAITELFNTGNHRIGNGKTISVKAIPMGSGDAIEEILSGRHTNAIAGSDRHVEAYGGSSGLGNEAHWLV